MTHHSQIQPDQYGYITSRKSLLAHLEHIKFRFKDLEVHEETTEAGKPYWVVQFNDPLPPRMGLPQTPWTIIFENTDRHSIIVTPDWCDPQEFPMIPLATRWVDEQIGLS